MTGPQTLDRARPDPLWAQLLADLRRRLDDGEFAVAFPGELALVAEYSVSRHTRPRGVAQAAAGRPGSAGPVEIRQPLGALYSLFSSVEAAGLSQRSVVRTLEVRADGVIAARMGLEESTPLVYLERLRMAGTAPLAVDESVAAFAVERLGLSGGRAVEWRHMLARGDRFTVTADFSVRDGYHLGLNR
ncbi:MAG: GntR family transcriptional regulator [Pseudonocardia sp.]|nr:GntR family transcriptional regulator [Pseudonocardia sp.]